MIFTDDVEVFIPPKKGRKHVLRVIRELLYSQPQGTGTSISTALEYVNRVIHRRSVIFLISDFIDSEYEQALRLIRRRHDLISIALVDPRERALPDVGFVTLQAAETGAQMVIDSRDAKVRELFAASRAREEGRRTQMFRRLGIDEIAVDTSQSYVEPLVRFFRTRMQRLGAA